MPKEGARLQKFKRVSRVLQVRRAKGIACFWRNRSLEGRAAMFMPADREEQRPWGRQEIITFYAHNCRKIIGWRNYKRYKAPEPIEDVASLVPSHAQEEEIIDASRRRCYAVKEIITSANNTEHHVVKDHVLQEGSSTLHETEHHAVNDHVLQERSSNFHETHDNILHDDYMSSEVYVVETSNLGGHMDHEESSQLDLSYHVSLPITSNECLAPQCNAMENYMSQEHATQIGFQSKDHQTTSYHVTQVSFDNEEDEDEDLSLGAGSFMELMTKGTEMPNKDNSKSRSSRIIKRPKRYMENCNRDKENIAKIPKKSKETSLKDKSSTIGKEIDLVDMDLEEMEVIVVEAMGINDIDEMYSQLWTNIKEARSLSKSLFKECSSKSDPKYLLRCYVSWVLYCNSQT